MSTERAAEPPEVTWTPRQREVLDLLARGYTNGQVAEALGISLDGAKWHVSEVIAKLGVDTREEAAEHWRRERGIARRLRDFPRRMSVRALGWWAAAAGTATAAVVAVAAVGFFGGDSSGAATAGWERLPDPPIPPRATAVLVWTGEEVLVIGGDTFRCSPFAGCAGPDFPALSDGAALDSATGAWRRIADAPVPIESASAAVIGDGVYLLASVRGPDFERRTAFLRYSIGSDSWEELPWDPTDWWPRHSYSLTATAGKLLAYPQHRTAAGLAPGLAPMLFDPVTVAWEELSVPPVGDQTWEVIVRDDDDRLYVVQTGQGTRILQLDLANRSWNPVAETPREGYAGIAEGGRLFIPAIPSPAGARTEPERAYPWGLVVDLVSGTIAALPDGGAPAETFFAGNVGRAGAVYHVSTQRGGHVLMAETGTWFEMAPLGEDAQSTDRTVAAAGRDAFAFGGVAWPPGGPTDGELLGDAWIWRAPD